MELSFILHSYFFLFQPVAREISDWWAVLWTMRDEWSFVTTESGAQCVTTSGVLLMPMLSVDSWDIVTQVNVFAVYNKLHSLTECL